MIIDEWKRSVQVTYTRGGNPRPPELETVVSWVQSAWKQTPVSVVEKSVQICGFDDDSSNWFISKHDVYGVKFRQQWELHETSHDDSDVDENEVEPLMDALDEIVIDESEY